MLTDLPKKIGHAASIEMQALRIVLRHGMPGKMLQFGGGIGDELLLTAVAHELRNRHPRMKIWQVSHSAPLLANNPDYHRVFTMDIWQLRYAKFLNLSRLRLAYAHEIVPRVRELPPDRPIIAELCHRAGITGKVALRPYLYLTREEQEAGRLAPRQVVVHNCGDASFATVMRNKVWCAGKMQQVVESLHARHDNRIRIIQIGGSDDPPLVGVHDLRGKTSLRQSAAILHQAACFIGTVGFLMHLARAVECRSVIVFGGREHAHQTGYVCNENLESFPECAPCWTWNDCDHDLVCMRAIHPDAVVRATDRVLDRFSTHLETEMYHLS